MPDVIGVDRLTVQFNLLQKGERHKFNAVDDLTLDVLEGEILGIIGESGSGKSTLAFGILNLVDAPGRITAGSVHLLTGRGERVSLLELDAKSEREFRWRGIATVFQAAQSALNPITTVWEHFRETVEAHESADLSGRDARARAEELVSYVRLEPRVLDMYPFELSGGMKQRVLIALSLLLDPRVIILDEPTTALDVITQWHILEILKKINRERGVTMIFLTHDILIVSSMAHRLVVMYGGQIVEVAPTAAIYRNPQHPYTQALMQAIPTLHDDLSTRRAIRGAAVDMLALDGKCRFLNRCAVAPQVGCDGAAQKVAELFDVGTQHQARCWYATQGHRAGAEAAVAEEV
ncbi:MAG: ABC transporter ATP-binding protein [Candidatus Nanopelagicales bacterium]